MTGRSDAHHTCTITVCKASTGDIGAVLHNVSWGTTWARLRRRAHNAFNLPYYAPVALVSDHDFPSGGKLVRTVFSLVD